jgi:hypothetical protein
MTEDEVRELLKQKRRRDRFEAIYGPVRIADTVIWEVWVEFEDEYQTRFVEEQCGAEPIIYDTFQALSLKLQDRHLALMDRLQKAEQAKVMDQAKLQSDLAMKAADGASRRFSAMMKDILAATGFAVASTFCIFGGHWPKRGGCDCHAGRHRRKRLRILLRQVHFGEVSRVVWGIDAAGRAG